MPTLAFQTTPLTPDVHRPYPACGCGSQGSLESGQVMRGVDPDTRHRNMKRLRRIEGQVRGLQKMVDEDRYCADIMVQISSVHEALRSVGRELMRSHLRHCTEGISATGGGADPVYDELIDMMYRLSR